jgi:hypothetical protein
MVYSNTNSSFSTFLIQLGDGSGGNLFVLFILLVCINWSNLNNELEFAVGRRVHSGGKFNLQKYQKSIKQIKNYYIHMNIKRIDNFTSFL